MTYLEKSDGVRESRRQRQTKRNDHRQKVLYGRGGGGGGICQAVAYHVYDMVADVQRHLRMFSLIQGAIYWTRLSSLVCLQHVLACLQFSPFKFE